MIAAAMAAVCIGAFIAIRMLTARRSAQVRPAGRFDTGDYGCGGKGTLEEGLSRGIRTRLVLRAGHSAHIWFGDLEGKGPYERSFCLFRRLDPQSPHSSTLICYSDRGKEKWRWTPGRELPELAGSPATYMTLATWGTEGNGEETFPNRRFKSALSLVAQPDRDPRCQRQNHL